MALLGNRIFNVQTGDIHLTLGNNRVKFSHFNQTKDVTQCEKIEIIDNQHAPAVSQARVGHSGHVTPSASVPRRGCPISHPEHGTAAQL